MKKTKTHKKVAVRVIAKQKYSRAQSSPDPEPTQAKKAPGRPPLNTAPDSVAAERMIIEKITKQPMAKTRTVRTSSRFYRLCVDVGERSTLKDAIKLEKTRFISLLLDLPQHIKGKYIKRFRIYDVSDGVMGAAVIGSKDNKRQFKQLISRGAGVNLLLEYVKEAKKINLATGLN